MLKNMVFDVGWGYLFAGGKMKSSGSSASDGGFPKSCIRALPYQGKNNEETVGRERERGTLGRGPGTKKESKGRGRGDRIHRQTWRAKHFGEEQ